MIIKYAKKYYFPYFSLKCVEKGEVPYEFTMFLISCGVHMFIPSYFGDMMIEKV